jgi:hypothetical protein
MREGCRAHHAKYRSHRADSAAHLARLRNLPTLHPGRLLCAPTTPTPTANTGVLGSPRLMTPVCCRRRRLPSRCSATRLSAIFRQSSRAKVP